jgi:hypothetical protein
MPEISVVIENPIGSLAENMSGSYGMRNLNPASLSSLANYTASGAITYGNELGATTCDIIIELSNLNMPSAGYLRIDNGTNYYELAVPAGNAGKRLIFASIPASFLSSFTVFNGTGLSLNSSGNFITVVPNL